MPPRRHDRPMEASGNARRRMRKGTHCCFASDTEKFAASSLRTNRRRGTVCIPQGLHTESTANAHVTEDLAVPLGVLGDNSGDEPRTSKEEVTLTGAIEHLKTKVARSLEHALPASADQASLPGKRFPSLQTPAGTCSKSESVRTDCAPIMKLFDNELVRGSQLQSLDVVGMLKLGQVGHHLESETSAGHLEYSRRESKFTSHPNCALPLRHAKAVQDLCAALPPECEMKMIFDNRSDWWDTWRESFGLIWGDEADTTRSRGHPSLLGSLLVCFAASVGSYDKYLLPVARWILSDDELAGCEYGLLCLMGLGLCFLSMLQPRRAWTVYRRANALLQLNGIHRTHKKSEKLDSIFWQLFYADRWVSLMIGLPYSVPDNLCDLYIPPKNTLSFVTFHYRHFAVLTGRVIDCLQALNGPSLSAIAAIDEKIDEVTSHLPPDYLDLAQISACQNAKEKYTRVFRLIHVHQLKAYLHLPLFLQFSEDRREYGRKMCVNNSRALIEAFLEIYDANYPRSSMDHSIKLTGFTVFTAAVTLFLHLLGYGLATTSGRAPENQASIYDVRLISRAIAALKDCSEVEQWKKGVVRKIDLPYFDVVSIGRNQDVLGHSRDGSGISSSANEHATYQNSTLVETPDIDGNNILDFNSPLDDIFWVYQGPWVPCDPMQPFVPVGGQSHTDCDCVTGDAYGNIPVT
ncbi:hypothetical protein V1517DRAFT_376798 [Lipomyces orientalis]|uniref:Uncharacterized protein n=1 Tax=Lipomyces orientalis TaxID=1233043 RepID=A0ACC3TE87_9ASCO